jgi:hypothetical protein
MPNTGPTTGGWAVTISGTNFEPGANVRFGGSLATNVAVTSTSISCFTPPGPLGLTAVEVDNPDGNQVTLANGFTYVPTLTLAGVSPLAAAPGATVTVTGGGFASGLVASVGGVPVTVGTLTSTSFTFLMPNGSFCHAPLIVSLPDGQTNSLTMNLDPVIGGIIGPNGSPSGGSLVFVLGSNFYAGTMVTIGGVPAVIVSSTSTAMLISTPPNPSGPASLIVTSVAGCAATTTYTYQ